MMLVTFRHLSYSIGELSANNEVTEAIQFFQGQGVDLLSNFPVIKPAAVIGNFAVS